MGNVGALGQSSLKRMLAYSSVAQAGYMLAGVVVATRLGVQATVFYLAVYLFMNMAAFAVIVARERETRLGDSIEALAGLGRERPLLAWPMTISMLGLAGIPATAGFIGKFYLIDATVSGGYTWLGVMIVIGSMISLAYYLPVIAAMWMREAPALRGRQPPSRDGGAFPPSPAAPRSSTRPLEQPRGRQLEVVAVALICGAATIVLRDRPAAAVRPRPARGRGAAGAVLSEAARWHMPGRAAPRPARAAARLRRRSPGSRA